MKHVHYDKIVAKAANMELVVFCKGINDGCEWHEVKRFPNWQTNASYFLCLPQHKETCLHWLNGGESQVASISSGWLPANLGDPAEWGGEWWYMNPNGESRIKPKKEKRWIGFNSKTLMTTRDTYTTGVECEDALNKVGEIYENHPWQFIEIEVEA